MIKNTLLIVFIAFSILGCSPKSVGPHLDSDKMQVILDPLGHTSKIGALLVTKNGDIITASNDKTIRIWDSNTLKEKRRIYGEVGNGAEGMIYALALSPDERYLAVGGYLGSFKELKDRTKEEAHKVRIYDYKTGKMLHLLEGNEWIINTLSFSKDGKFMSSAGWGKNIIVYDVEDNFSLYKLLQQQKNPSYAAQIMMIKDKYYVLSTSIKGDVSLIDIETDELVNNANIRMYIKSMAINYQLGHIALCGKSKRIVILDFDLFEVNTITKEDGLYSVSYSEDGSLLMYAQSYIDPSIVIHKADDSYKEVASYSELHAMHKEVAFINNTRAVGVGGKDHSVHVWDINNTSSFIKTQGVGSIIYGLALEGNILSYTMTNRSKNPKEKKLSLSNHFNIKSLELLQKESKKYLKLPLKYKDYSLVHSRGKRYGYPKEVLKIYKGDKFRQSIEARAWTGYQHNAYGWYKSYIVSAGMNGNLRIYNIRGEEIAELVGHTGSIDAINIQGDILVSGSQDQQIKIWDLSVLGKEKILHPKLTLFFSKGKEWIIWTEEGYYYASKEGDKFLKYQVNQGYDKEAFSYKASEVSEQFNKKAKVLKWQKN